MHRQVGHNGSLRVSRKTKKSALIALRKPVSPRARTTAAGSNLFDTAGVLHQFGSRAAQRVSRNLVFLAATCSRYRSNRDHLQSTWPRFFLAPKNRCTHDGHTGMYCDHYWLYCWNPPACRNGLRNGRWPHLCYRLKALLIAAGAIALGAASGVGMSCLRYVQRPSSSTAAH